MNILEITSNIRLRLDYFSMPGICRKIVDVVHELYGGEVPERRLMTTYDKELLDLDSISNVLDVTIEEIIQKPVSIFSDSVLGGYPVRIYVAENFLFVNVTIPEEVRLKSYKDVSGEFSKLLDCIIERVGEDLKIIRVTSTIYAPCIIDKGDVERRLNVALFPIIAENGRNARYAENYNEDGFDTTTIRDILYGTIDVEDQKHLVYKIECTINSSTAEIQCDKKELFVRMFEKAVDRTNKYFK